MYSEHGILEIHEKLFGKVDKKAGYSIMVRRSKSGNWVVTKYYQRSSWVDSEKERVWTYDSKGNLLNQQS